MSGVPASIINISGPPDLNGNFTTNFDPTSTTPSAFSFTPVTGAALGEDYDASATITGISSVHAPISIVGGEYKIGDGEYTELPGTITNGDVVTVKLTSGEEHGEATTLYLTIGDVTEEFTVTTSLATTLIGALEIVGMSVPTNEGYGLYGFGTVPGEGEEPPAATLTVMEENGYKFLRAHYNANNVGSTSIYGGCGLDQTHGDREVYFAYWARMPNAKYGLKNVKMFGIVDDVDPTNYANATFSLDYTHLDDGSMRSVQWGDGATVENDSNNSLKFDGTNPEWIGRSFGTAVVSTPQNANFPSTAWGTSWHLIQLMFRHSEGTSPETEIANGATYVAIDGLVYADADGILTRHFTNKLFRGIGLFNITQENGDLEFDFDICEGAIASSGGFMAPLVTPI